MAREIAKVVVTALLFLGISEVLAYPRIVRQSSLDSSLLKGDLWKGYTSPGGPSTASLILLGFASVPNMPEEIKEDIKTLAGNVEKKEKELGHSMTDAEKDQFEDELEELPWYKRMNDWLEKNDAFKTNEFEDEDVERDQRAVHLY
ncbi:unnamed protein product [Allacma fusca]|uniref:Uncharacterized protein n=1 Tax=Allacma fusca TaxID=39272 RepID=A0A8J2PHJ2_9HEXA|nr:unnamed protein product [Allacma fusca]